MSKGTNILAKAGEGYAQSALLADLPLKFQTKHPKYLFEASYLGEKNELFDFLIYLLGPNEQLTGAHFFVQVKTVGSKTQVKNNWVPARFSKNEVLLAQTFRVPSYLVAIVNGSKPKAYIRGIQSAAKKGMSGVSTKHSVFSPKVRIQIYDDVSGYFATQKYAFTSSL